MRRFTLHRTTLLLAALSGLVLAAACASSSRAEPPEKPTAEIPPLRFQGEPFFPVGTFGWPQDDPGWAEAGGNTALKHVGIKGELTEAKLDQMRSDLKAYLDRCETAGVACVIYPVKVEGHKLYRAAYDEAFREKTKRFLHAVLEITGDHPAVLGYWTYDEPENHLWSEWKKRAKPGDLPSERMHDAFAEWAVERLGWIADLIRRRDADGYVMPTIAWWNMYERLAPLVDVHVPNDYPTLKGEAPLSGSLYDVVYDAAKAAQAARETSVHSFIYMPGIFDVIGGRWRGASFEEMRYLWFAPLTQGARGFLSWRISRASPEHRQDVLYPVMAQVTRFSRWWIAPALDHHVRSDRDTASVEYLKRFPELIRTVAGEQIERREVRGLPDVSYTLRRVEGEGYLLLAVNNRKERTPVTFMLEALADGTPQTIEVSEAISGRTLQMRQGRLSDELSPFGVGAYRFRVRSP